MKIEIEIPEWAEAETIYVLGGINLIAIKEPGEDLEVKTARCCRCGQCCSGLPETWIHKTENGICEHLTVSGKGDGTTQCSLGVMRPTLCSIDKTASAEYCVTEFVKNGNRR